MIDEDPILKPFVQIPSKEGEIGIEGIAVDGNTLHVSFRGPVIRDGYVPILVFDFDQLDKADMLFVNLGGLGIRDMVAMGDGAFVIGAPIGDEPIGFKPLRWNGKDGVPGDGAELARPESFGRTKLTKERLQRPKDWLGWERT